MSFINYFENTYSLDSFLKTILTDNYWGISQLGKFKEAQKKNLDAAIHELKTFASTSLSNQELLSKLRMEKNKLRTAEKKLSGDGLNEHQKILKELLKKLSAELEILIDDAKSLTINYFTYAEIEEPLKKSNYRQPVRFFRSLLQSGNLNLLKAEFFEYWKNNGFDIDEATEKCVDWEDPGWVVEFSDELEENVAGEKARSINLIADYISQNWTKPEDYIKAIYLELVTLLPETNNIEIKKYQFIKKAIQELKRHLEKSYPHHIHSAKTKPLVSNTEAFSFIYLLKGKVSEQALRSFFGKLKREGFIAENTTLPAFKKAIKGQDHSERIMWLKGPESLRHLINRLIYHNVIKYKGKNKWGVVCNTFIKGDLTEFDPINLGKGHKPSDTKTLDQICNILIRLTEANK